MEGTSETETSPEVTETYQTIFKRDFKRDFKRLLCTQLLPACMSVHHEHSPDAHINQMWGFRYPRTEL